VREKWKPTFLCQSRFKVAEKMETLILPSSTIEKTSLIYNMCTVVKPVKRLYNRFQRREKSEDERELGFQR